MSSSSTSADASVVKPNATIATKIGLSVPIKEKTIKTFVNHLGSQDTNAIVPKQVPKMTIVAVSAVIEKLLQTMIAKTTVESSSFGVDHVMSPIIDAASNSDYLCVLAPFVATVNESLEIIRAQKKAKKSKKDGQNVAIENDGGEEEVVSDNEDNNQMKQFSFSCSNQIAKQIKSQKDNIRVSSDAIDAIQLFLDEFYQKLVTGAYWIAQNSGRKTISRNDVIVSLKIIVSSDLARDMLEHIESLSTKYKEVEANKSCKDDEPKEPKKTAAKPNKRKNDEVTTIAIEGSAANKTPKKKAAAVAKKSV